MNTKCTPNQLELQGFQKQKIIVTNDADVASSDGGLILLQQIEKKYKVIRRLSKCFRDSRSSARTEHTVYQLLSQRIFGLCQGYEDLIDHDQWRTDPLLSLVCGKENGAPLSGKSTLNRLELGKEIAEYGNRYNKIQWDDQRIENLLVDLFLDSFSSAPKVITLDFDATDDPLHGNQEGKFFHGYYDSYCYLPLYVFSGSFPLVAKLRPSNIDASKGTVEILKRIVPCIRDRFPKTQIIFRADSGFCREPIMRYCDENRVKYVIGLPKNNRLKRALGKVMNSAKILFERTGKKARVFTDLVYQTKKSWSRSRRVVGKAEYLSKGPNPRFVVTNFTALQWSARTLYEKLYCGRGDMENRIKEQQLYLFADRTSTGWMSSNQLRLWYSTFAYLFFVLLREKILEGTDWEKSQCSTLRLKIMKVAASIRITTRRIYIRLPYAYPYWDSWIQFSKAA
jgi:hypothetical protein